MVKAHKVQQGAGQKGNRNYQKENLVNTHKKSKIVLNDERVKKIKINISHPRRCPDGMNKEIQVFELDAETRRWTRDNYTVRVI